MSRGGGARVLALALVVAGAGCSAVLRFNECNGDQDCFGQADGGMLYCTSDHMCVDALPDDRLCRISQPATAAGDALVIAGLYKLNKVNPDDTDDHAIKQAGDLAALELNTLSVPVTHVACDTAADPAQAKRALRAAVERFHAVGIIGPDTSGEVVAVAPLIHSSGAAVISPSATNPAIRDLDDADLLWRTCPSDNLQAKVLAQLVPAMASLDIVWVTPNLYADGLEQAFVQASGRTDATVITFAAGMAAGAVQKMNAPAYALLIADADAPDLVRALKGAAGQSMTQYLMTDGALAPTLWGEAPFDFNFLGRIRGTAPALPATGDPSRPIYDGFSTQYKAHFMQEDPKDTAFVANAYDAFYLLAIAAAAAGPKPTGTAIAANLARMSSGSRFPVGSANYLAAVRALEQGGTIDVVGASGPVDFDDKGDIVSAPIEVWKIAQDATAKPTFAVVMTVTP